MDEHAPQSEQSELNLDDLFGQHLSNAFAAAAAIRARLYALRISHGSRTPQQVEAMAQIAEELQRMDDFLGT